MKILPDWADSLVKQNTRPGYTRKLATVMIFMTLIGLFFLVMPAFAGIGSFFGYPDGMKKIYTHVLTGVSVRRTVSMCFGKEVLEKINGLTAIIAIRNVVAGIGIALVLVHVVMAIMEASEYGELTIERLYRLLLTFALPILLIINIGSLSDAIQKGGLLLKDTIIETLADDTKEVALTEDQQIDWDYSNTGIISEGEGTAVEDYAIATDVYKNGVFDHVKGIVDPEAETEDDDKGEDVSTLIGLMSPMPDPEDVANAESALKNLSSDSTNSVMEKVLEFVCIVIIICIDLGLRISIMISCYGALGRMIIYQAFLPIGIADIGKEGFRSNGMRVIKLYIAVFIEIGMYYFLIFAGWKIFDILALRQTTVAGLVICFVGAGSGIRAMMSSSKNVTERILNIR